MDESAKKVMEQEVEKSARYMDELLHKGHALCLEIARKGSAGQHPSKAETEFMLSFMKFTLTL